MAAHLLTKQVEGALHDTQVCVRDAVGHPTWTRNANADALKACDMGSLVQRTHHWSPLQDCVSFVATDKDRNRAMFRTPKDRHIFRWIEVNARFGIIKRQAPEKMRSTRRYQK